MATVRRQERRDTAAHWTAINPVLAQGEIGFETDTGQFKFGNGSSTWTALTYYIPGAGGTGAVSSVDGRIGSVVLHDLYDVAGSATTAQGTAISTANAYTDAAFAGTPIYFRWNAGVVDYQPTTLKGNTARVKVFIGPTDPATVSGVILADGDEWTQTS